MRRDKPSVTEDPIVSTLAKLTWPMIFGMMGVVIFNLVDTIYVGMIGVNELAAIGFAFPVIMLVRGVSAGMGIGTASVFSRMIVSKERSGRK